MAGLGDVEHSRRRLHGHAFACRHHDGLAASIGGTTLPMGSAARRWTAGSPSGSAVCRRATTGPAGQLRGARASLSAEHPADPLQSAERGPHPSCPAACRGVRHRGTDPYQSGSGTPRRGRGSRTGPSADGSGCGGHTADRRGRLCPVTVARGILREPDTTTGGPGRTSWAACSGVRRTEVSVRAVTKPGRKTAAGQASSRCAPTQFCPRRVRPTGKAPTRDEACSWLRG